MKRELGESPHSHWNEQLLHLCSHSTQLFIQHGHLLACLPLLVGLELLQAKMLYLSLNSKHGWQGTFEEFSK
jgi:hypothetical protein